MAEVEFNHQQNITHIQDNIIKSNDVICPICKEICKYEIKEHKIKLYDCKNGHITDNIKLDELTIHRI